MTPRPKFQKIASWLHPIVLLVLLALALALVIDSASERNFQLLPPKQAVTQAALESWLQANVPNPASIHDLNWWASWLAGGRLITVSYYSKSASGTNVRSDQIFVVDDRGGVKPLP